MYERGCTVLVACYTVKKNSDGKIANRFLQCILTNVASIHFAFCHGKKVTEPVLLGIQI
jgi:hypothetical protein